MSHNSESFDYKPNKVLFAILYLEGPAFDFIKVYLNNYNNNTNFKNIRLETRDIFRNISKFVKILTKVYRKLYKDEKATY